MTSKSASGTSKTRSKVQDVTPGSFEDGDALSSIDGVLKDGLSLLWREMVEGSEERAKAVELRRDFSDIDGSRVEMDPVPRGDFALAEGCCIWVFVRETNGNREANPWPVKGFVEPEPGSAGA